MPPDLGAVRPGSSLGLSRFCSPPADDLTTYITRGVRRVPPDLGAARPGPHSALPDFAVDRLMT